MTRVVRNATRHVVIPFGASPKQAWIEDLELIPVQGLAGINLCL